MQSGLPNCQKKQIIDPAYAVQAALRNDLRAKRCADWKRKEECAWHSPRLRRWDPPGSGCLCFPINSAISVRRTLAPRSSSASQTICKIRSQRGTFISTMRACTRCLRRIIKNVKGFSGPFSAVCIKCALGDSGSQLSKRRWLCPCARIVKTTVWRDGCAMRSMRPPCKDRCNSEAQAYRLMPSSCKTNSSSVSICL